MAQDKRRALSTDDWADAALEAIGQAGLAAVAVEPLAKRLGATKGSFYWHFSNREALVEAALARWEARNTEAVIDGVETASAGGDAKERLRNLFKAVPAATAGDPIEVALLASAHHPLVAPVLQRVTRRRIEYVTRIFLDLGFSSTEARRRGLLIYTAHLGQTQLVHAAPDVLPATRPARKRYLDTLLSIVLRD